MRDTIDIGPSPHEETCAQLGQSDYEVRSYVECCAFREQLMRAYKNAHGTDIPKTLSLRVKSFSHDFGTYREVVASFDDSDNKAVDAAYWLEANSPARWDDEASLLVKEQDREAIRKDTQT